MRTQPTLGLNINIMDEQGVIIGSSNPDRLFAFHAGARQVLETGEPLTLTPEEAARFPGSQAGVNLPVRLHGRLVGVVGITGLPEQVTGYGQLLQTAVEMMLEQAWLQEQLSLESGIREGLVQRLLDPVPEADWAVLAARARVHGYNLEQPYVALVLQLADPASGANERELTSLQHQLLQRFARPDVKGPTFLAAPLADNRLVLLSPLFRGQKSHALGESLIDLVDSQGGGTARVGIGSTAATGRELHRSFRDAALVVDVLTRLNDPRTIVTYDELGPGSFAALLPPERCPILERLDRAFSPLDPAFVEEIRTTLDTFFAKGLNQSQAAAELHMHRNTLNYRLDKVHELTGLNPRYFPDAVQIYMGRLLRRFHGDGPVVFHVEPEH